MEVSKIAQIQYTAKRGFPQRKSAAMVETFLSTAFEGGRHARRVALMDAIEG